ncbi:MULTISPECIES: hypothetical protein [Sphingomonas]|uniref:Uncharacterized protein n=1 Tax=Sphingomonas zeae TaxID=1646122 RepID=A0A7Y6B1Q5_9SPHN|nr:MULTISPECIES: hypothetical protein [Sphingomonas]MBB4050026.1 hypothetical protein [Sphingomonas zeae]MDK8218048.1 hypothetical protein [Sphingomonas sp. UMB7805-LC452B]NUU45693.1 hypothetical protein [Sphingomonas zeae]
MPGSDRATPPIRCAPQYWCPAGGGRRVASDWLVQRDFYWVDAAAG